MTKYFTDVERMELAVRQNQASAAQYAVLADRWGMDNPQQWWTLSAMLGAIADSMTVRSDLPCEVW